MSTAAPGNIYLISITLANYHLKWFARFGELSRGVQAHGVRFVHVLEADTYTLVAVHGLYHWELNIKKI